MNSYSKSSGSAPILITLSDFYGAFFSRILRCIFIPGPLCDLDAELLVGSAVRGLKEAGRPDRVPAVQTGMEITKDKNP